MYNTPAPGAWVENEKRNLSLNEDGTATMNVWSEPTVYAPTVDNDFPRDQPTYSDVELEWMD